MVPVWRPSTVEELTSMLVSAAAASQRLEILGAASKRSIGGAPTHVDVALSTASLNRVLEYEPKDLTISVEAGLPWSQLVAILAANNQTIPLDPPWFDHATVGGVIAANSSGPRRRLFGTARDVVIGMKFATLKGQLIQSGGMVVKNVAGLDMGKLMIGSLGTLAVITSVNFKLTPLPPASRTFAFQYDSLAEALATRNRILESVLQPAAIDLLNPQAAPRLGLEGWVLLVEAVGSPRVIDRYSRELPHSQIVDSAIWARVREFVPHFLDEHPQGAVCRVSTPIQGVAAVAGSAPVPLIARAGNGVSYACFPDCQSAVQWLKHGAAQGWHGVVEAAPPHTCSGVERWPNPATDFEVMKKIKQLLDPANLLNPGRLYGRL
jgi:glycolate oxidase FAD binding subunit